MILDLAEAAEQLGYTVKGLRKLILTPHGPEYSQARPHAPILFKQEWLDEWLEKNKKSGADSIVIKQPRKRYTRRSGNNDNQSTVRHGL